MLKFVSISNVATFTGEPQEFGELEKINFVYGSNGCGKTTISRVIAHPEKHPSCALRWEGDIPLSTFVYNRDFVEDNFKSSGPIKGIFTLGTEDAAIRNEIAEKERLIADCDSDIKRARFNLSGEDGNGGKKKELQDKEEEIRAYCWDKIKRPNDERFRQAFEGLRGSKESFANELQRRFSNNVLPCRDEAELIADSKAVFNDNAVLYEPYRVPSFDALVSSLNEDIYARKIVGGEDVGVANLISRLQNSDWVRRGQEMLSQSGGQCPFCQQKLPDGFAEELSRYFDETFAANISSLNVIAEKSRSLLNDLDGDVCKVLESPQGDFLNLEALSVAKQNLDVVLSLIRERIDGKIREPSRAVEFPINELKAQKQAIESIFQEANAKIEKQNELVHDLSESKRRLIEDIWVFLIENHREKLKELLASKESIKKAISGLDQYINEQNKAKTALESEHANLQKKLTSVLPTITAINKLLDSFGFTSFRLTAEGDSYYKLQRPDGSDVGDTLSEGEKSFVTFLYFHHLLRGATDSSLLGKDRVIVIDDPISSLDSNVLFIVSSLVRACIDDILGGKGNLKQLIVLTHNAYFYKEITFISGGSRKAGKDDRTYWIVRKNGNESIVCPEKDRTIMTSYELLWREIRERNIPGLQNIMRRIIEHYFKLLGNFPQTEIEEYFEGNERIVCHSLFSWMNDGSHSIDDDICYQATDAEIEVYKTVFEKIFEMSGHKAHYDMMMRSTERT